MTHRDGFPRFSARSAWRGDAGHRKPCARSTRSSWRRRGTARARSPGTGGVKGYCVGRKRVRRLMRLMGLQAVYQAPKGNHSTSDPHPDHRITPYLLRGLGIGRANQVWSTDITIRRENGPLDRFLVLLTPMRRDFWHLAAIMDWASRKVRAWRLSSTMEADFCVAALEQARARIGGWIDYYNTSRPHSVFDGRTSEEVYTGRQKRWQRESHYGLPPNKCRKAPAIGVHLTVT